MAPHLPRRASKPDERRSRAPVVIVKRRQVNTVPGLRWHALHRVTTRAERLLHMLALPKAPTARRDWLARRHIATWLADPVVRADWLAVTRPPQRWALLATLFPRQIATLRRTSKLLLATRAALLPREPETTRNTRHWQGFIEQVMTSGNPPAPRMLVRQQVLRLADEQAIAHSHRPALLKRWWQTAANTVAQLTADKQASPLHRAPTAIEQYMASHRGQPATARHQAPEHLPDPVTMQDIEDTDTHYIADAGMVLLAVYTQPLFHRLALLSEGRFRDADAESRAVRCLTWLVHGHDKVSEPECVLAKLLCGMPLRTPLTGNPATDPGTQQMLEGLLSAVIAHWTALGNTSHRGLRETFLQREGRLTRESREAGAHWRLVVRAGPFDMLLDRLPWSYATIKLPWMKEVLHVDWR